VSEDRVVDIMIVRIDCPTCGLLTVKARPTEELPVKHFDHSPGSEFRYSVWCEDEGAEVLSVDRNPTRAEVVALTRAGLARYPKVQ
jgi:hypothetical protein